MFVVTAIAFFTSCHNERKGAKPSLISQRMQHEYPLLSSIPKVDPVEIRDLVSKHLQIISEIHIKHYSGVQDVMMVQRASIAIAVCGSYALQDA